MLKTNADRFVRSAGRTTRTPAAVAVLAAAAGLALPASVAVAQDAEFGPVIHEFQIQTQGTAPPRLVFTTDLRTWSTCDRDRDRDVQREQEDVDKSGDTRESKAEAGTVSIAGASITVSELDVGTASGEYAVTGSVELCVPVDVATGRAKSWAQMSYIGQTKAARGRIVQRGRWRNEPAVQGDTGRRRVRDPIVIRIIDLATGEVAREWTALTVDNFVHGGAFEWDRDRVLNRAPTMEFEIVHDGGFARPSVLRVVTELGVVTESVATGVFSGTAVPPLGSKSDFDFHLPNEIAFDFDAGLPTTDPGYQVEVDMSSAGEVSAWAGGGSGGGEPTVSVATPGDLYLHTDLFTAADGADPLELSIRPWMPLDYGVPLATGSMHAVVPLTVEGDGPVQLGKGIVSVVDLGSKPEAPIEAMFHVRLWPGNSEPYPALPSASAPIGGDLVTDVMVAVDFKDVFCVYSEDLLDTRAPVKDVTLDLSHLPPLPPLEPGMTYWLEITATPAPGTEIFLPLSPYHGGDGLTPSEQISFMFAEEMELAPIQDPSTGRLYNLPLVVFSQGDAPGCVADCDGSGVLDIFDFLCFQNAFASGDPKADCDGSGVLDIFDFLCFQSAFAAGCP